MVVNAINSYEEFQTAINSGKPVLIDFFTPECVPCKPVSGALEILSKRAEYTGVDFYKVNVHEQEKISNELGVRFVPTFILFKDGDKVSDLVGANPRKLPALVEQASGLVA
ncbi:hypothetical protein M413DRAFT_449666 [Hebeloma cylindrosporum]|uniref:Thioredoxin n=1 Tax=Hebeloma cylindrosporum TaxID=76867 RepID=A0A0C3BW59_HEBCY|nr:hypothetical protein M413DRAFT_449666 [Hebeloma cylindrosporum h7]